MSGFILSLEIPRGQNFPFPFLCPCLSHFWSNPMLELFCWWELAAEDKGVETGFVDPNGMLSSSKTVCNRWGVSGTGHLIFIRNILSNSLCGIWIPQRSSYILTYEPWFPWDFNSSQLTELWVIEHCGWVCFWKYKGCPIWWPLARLQIWWHGKIFYPQLEVILSLSKKRWESAY